MAYIQGYITALDDLLPPAAPSNIPQSNTSSNQTGYHYFHVHCFSEEKILRGKKYASVNDIKKDAFDLYPDMGFNDDNVILTHLDNNQVEDLLIKLPDLSEKNHSKDLFIRFIHPACAMCWNPFGILDNQLLFQCSSGKCDAQYCDSCVQAVQGPLSEYSFVCINCKQKVTPQHNILIQKNIIWKSMCKLYGIQSFLDLKVNSKLSSCSPILKNIKFRIIHLKAGLRTLNCRLKTYNDRTGKQNPSSVFDRQLIINVTNLCTELIQLTERIKRTKQEIQQRNITVKNLLTKYKDTVTKIGHLCDTSTIAMIKSQTVNNNITTDRTDIHQEHTNLYSINDLGKLSFEQNIKVINDILQDTINDREYLLSLKDKHNETKSLQDILEQIEETLKIIPVVEQKLNDLPKSQQAIDDHIDEYYELLRDDDCQEIPCSKFILLLEKMRTRSEELEISVNFPKTINLKEKWQNDHGTDNNFKPKVPDLFQAVEMDVKSLLRNRNWIYSVPYKIGVIGATSVGKSALVRKLANLYDFPSMVSVERSTFGYLQFDALMDKDEDHTKVIPITFVDVEGSTDTGKHQSNGNYIELINKVDCDLYVIVFDNLFDEHNRVCQDHIEKELQRKCLLVRNKADVLFNNLLREEMEEKSTEEDSIDLDGILDETRSQALNTFDDKRIINEVYLTAAVCDDNLKSASSPTFDLKKLKNKFVNLAITESRAERIRGLGIRTSITVINTCFRRGYAVSKAKYKLLAAAGGIIPFLDEVPAWFGREKIRQAFGIHDSSAVTNALHGTEDVFETYLVAKNFKIQKGKLKSGKFKYLIAETAEQTTTDLANCPNVYIQQKPIENKSHIQENAQTLIRHTTEAVAKPVLATLIPTSLRSISTACIVVGAVITPFFAAWSFHSTGKSMNKELHLLCDDLVIILRAFLSYVCDHRTSVV